MPGLGPEQLCLCCAAVLAQLGYLGCHPATLGSPQQERPFFIPAQAPIVRVFPLPPPPGSAVPRGCAGRIFSRDAGASLVSIKGPGLLKQSQIRTPWSSWQCCCVSLQPARASVSPPEVLLCLCTCTGAFTQSGCAQCPGQPWCGQRSLLGT